MNLIAWWKVTTPEPFRSEEGLPVRRLVRVVVICGFGQILISEVVERAGLLLLTIFTDLTAVSVVMAQIILGLTYMSRLARRMPDLRLARRTGLVAWGLAVSWGLLVICSIGTFLPIQLQPAPQWVVAIGSFLVTNGLFILGPAVAGLVIFGIWLMLLIWRYRNKLGHAAKEAQLT